VLRDVTYTVNATDVLLSSSLNRAGSLAEEGAYCRRFGY
jgi:hypothetical protein